MLCWLTQEYGRRVFIGVEAYTHASRSLAVELIPAKRGDDKAQLRHINALDGLISTVRQPEIAYLRKRIAYETGRMKLQNFTRFIKHHTGRSPTEYRKRHRSSP